MYGLWRRYVDINTFEHLAREICEKVIGNISERNSDKISNKVGKLETEVNRLTKVIVEKDKLIKSLNNQLSENYISNKHSSDINEAIDNEWHAVKVKRKRNVEVSSQREFSIPLENRFEGMPIDKEFMKLVLNSIPLILR